MLIECYELLNSLKNTGFNIIQSHPDVKKPGKSPGYKVGLGSNGLPLLVEEIDRDIMGSLWYHREGKQNAFPVIKIKHALLAVPADDPLRKKFAELKKTNQQQRINLLREVINNRPFQFPEKDKKTWDRLYSKASEWINLFSSINKRYIALPHMLQRFTNQKVSAECLLHSLCHLIVQWLEQGRLHDVLIAEKLLIGVIDKKNLHKPAKAEVPVVFDVAEPDYPVMVADPEMGLFVSRYINANVAREPDGICALQGKPQPLLKKRFPEPNLGELGETKLFSKYKATPCEFRYLKNSADWADVSKSFPISERLVADIADGLKTLASPKLKGMTWRMVANGKWEGSGRNKREKKDLLLIYCDGQPVICKEAADTFGCDDKENRDQFENDAEALCKALEGIICQHPQSLLHILLIGKADKEKKQLLMHLIPTPKEVFEAAERWRKSVRDNLPTVQIPLPAEDMGQKYIEGQPLPPYPDRIVRLLSSKWVRGGMDELKLEGPTLRQVLDVMLRSPGKWEQAAENLLNLTVERIGPLFIGVAAAFHSKEKDRIRKFKLPARIAALRAIALLGILLYALGREKEVYMKETAFLLGRLLSLADTLHREYCIHVRKGSIPSQLIGNALMPVAADNPQEAIDRLRERLNIYQAWATKVSGEEYRLAKWAVNQMGEICYLIKRPLPTETDQKFRAELFLGYLARSTKDN